MGSSVLIKKRIAAMLGQLSGVTGAYQREFRSKFTIVAFHRVNDELPEDGITCGSKKFEAFCAFFRRYFRVVPLADQIDGCRAGSNMGGTLSITFDDGYLDNAEVAAPILRRFGLPATFFVTTGFLGTNEVPFWDQGFKKQPGWMTWDHVRALAAQGFEIGNHTDSHINMGLSAPDVIRRELEVSKQKLVRELGKPCNLFAYPFGGREQFSEEARSLVRAAGFSSCVSCYGGVNAIPADQFSLKRVGIGDWFARPHQLGFDLLRWSGGGAAQPLDTAHP